MITFSFFQVAGEWTLHRGEFFLDLRRLIGRSRARNEIPLRRLLDSGANVTLSSDYDVSALSPFQGMQHAVTRNDQAVELKVITNNYSWIFPKKCFLIALKAVKAEILE